MRGLFLLLAALTLSASKAAAVPNITVTGCDTVSTSPLQVRTTFTVDMPASGPWCDIYVWAAQGSGTQILGCGGAPAGFQCDLIPSGNPSPRLNFSQLGRCFHSGDHFEGFAILADRPAPCVALIFYGPLLLEGASSVDGLDGSYAIQACLAKDMPTPAGATSWGHVKAIYR